MRLALRRCSGVFQKPKREVVAVPVGSVVGLDDGVRQRAGRWQWRECAALLRTVSDTVDTAVTMFSGAAWFVQETLVFLNGRWTLSHRHVFAIVTPAPGSDNAETVVLNRTTSSPESVRVCHVAFRSPPQPCNLFAFSARTVRGGIASSAD